MYGRIKAERRCDVDAAGLPALIVVLIKADVRPQTQDMRAFDNAQIVEDLRSGHRAESARSVDVGQRNVPRTRVLEVKRRYIGKVGIGFALRE